MISHNALSGERRRARRELLHNYLRLQRELIDGNPASSSYQATIHAFRQMGYVLISSGFHDDLDRLLRIRVLDGGRATRRLRDVRDPVPELEIIEQRPVSELV